MVNALLFSSSTRDYQTSCDSRLTIERTFAVTLT
jgi:hypothetical protein